MSDPNSKNRDEQQSEHSIPRKKFLKKRMATAGFLVLKGGKWLTNTNSAGIAAGISGNKDTELSISSISMKNDMLIRSMDLKMIAVGNP